MTHDPQDPFTTTARAEGYARIVKMRESAGISDDIAAWFPAGFEKGAEWAREQEPTDAAQIIDQHRSTGRWVGDGVRVECACGHLSVARYDFSGPITAEQNNHRDADRKHAAHVAEALSAARRAREEKP